jgi:hypothetical protein
VEHVLGERAERRVGDAERAGPPAAAEAQPGVTDRRLLAAVESVDCVVRICGVPLASTLDASCAIDVFYKYRAEHLPEEGVHIDVVRFLPRPRASRTRDYRHERDAVGVDISIVAGRP